MSILRKPVTFRNLETGHSASLTALIGSDSALTVLPSRVVKDLSLQFRGRRDFRLPDGSLVACGIVFAEVGLAGRWAYITCAVWEDEPSLGRAALAELGLGIDSETGELVPVLGRVGGGFR